MLLKKVDCIHICFNKRILLYISYHIFPIRVNFLYFAITDPEVVMETGPPKRESVFVIFSRFMTRHDQGHEAPRDQEVLVDRLFGLFDMNGELQFVPAIFKIVVSLDESSIRGLGVVVLLW